MLFAGLWGCAHVMHDCSHMTIDPRIPTMPGRSTFDFHRPGRRCLHHTRSAVRCWASRMKGELNPTKNRYWGERSCIWMTASNELVFLVWPLPETAMGAGLWGTLICWCVWNSVVCRYLFLCAAFTELHKIQTGENQCSWRSFSFSLLFLT